MNDQTKSNVLIQVPITHGYSLYFKQLPTCVWVYHSKFAEALRIRPTPAIIRFTDGRVWRRRPTDPAFVCDLCALKRTGETDKFRYEGVVALASTMRAAYAAGVDIQWK